MIARIAKEDLQPVADAIKLRMEQLELSQRAVAQLAGISVAATLKKILSAEEPYKLSTLQRVLSVLDSPEDPFPKDVPEVIAWLRDNGERIRQEIADRPIEAINARETAERETQEARERIKTAKKLEQEELGRLLKARRKELGLSLGEVGRQLGVTKQAIYNIERGSISPQSETFRSYILALGYPHDNANSLRNDTPVMPAWVTALKEKPQSVPDDMTTANEITPHRPRKGRET